MAIVVCFCVRRLILKERFYVNSDLVIEATVFGLVDSDAYRANVREVENSSKWYAFDCWHDNNDEAFIKACEEAEEVLKKVRRLAPTNDKTVLPESGKEIIVVERLVDTKRG